MASGTGTATLDFGAHPGANETFTASGTRLGNGLFRWPDRHPGDLDREFDLIVALVAANAI